MLNGRRHRSALSGPGVSCAPTVHARSRWALALALATLVLLTLPGVARAEPIRLWHAYRGQEEEALRQTLASWPGSPVEVLALPYDAYAAKLSAAIPLGEGPHLFIDAHERLGDYLQRGLVAEVGDALEGGDGPGPYVPQAVAAVKLGGKAYGVPLSQKCVALYVNRDLVSEVPPDLESFAELRGKLPAAVWPLAYEAESAYFHAAVLGAFGGSLLGPDDGFGFVGAPAEGSLELVKGLLAKRVVPADADGALVTQLFRSGRAAFAISGPWLASDLADSNVHYRLALLPRVRATGQPMRPLLTVEAVMLSADGAQRPEVRALARHIAGAEAARLRQRLARTVTARADVPAPADDDFLRVFTEQAAVAIVTPSSAAMRATWEPAAQAIRKSLRGGISERDALLEAKRRFDDVRRPPPPRQSPTPALVVLGLLALAGTFALVARARRPESRGRLRASLPAYAYVTHAVLILGLLVFVPLLAGAALSLYAGPQNGQYYAGLNNFVEILTARGGPLLGRGSFYLVLLVTLLWTVLNVSFHVGIGLLLGTVLSRPALKLKGLYRALLIVPWAVPSYITALTWKGMFHRQFGAVTGLTLWLNGVFGTDMQPIAWFSRFSTAFSANLATNVWLGFPFMMVVTLAALTSVPAEVLEAAEVDGATRMQRFFRVTLPIIMPTLIPAVLLGAIWTFNMFNVVFLVSGGEPDGQTDILVSEAYRWAFTREARYGYAAAYSVLIFVLLSGITRLPNLFGWWRQRRRARRLGAALPAAADAGGAR